ncbi:MAG: hypothetical protein AAGA15_07740 [Pseudomonadota bacterium]
MKVLFLVLAMAAGFAVQHEGRMAERVAVQAAQECQMAKPDAR